MTTPYAYDLPKTDAQRDAYTRALSLAFATTPESCAEWLQRAGAEHTRVLTDSAGEVAAGLLFVPAGQYFGGRSVPMWGVAGVAVPPESRGRGAAKELMRRCVLELRERGIPLSALYPATQWLYRGAGYEQAGILPEVRINPKQISVRRDDSDGPMIARAMLPSDDSAVRALYERVARDADGRLDRVEYIWNRIRNPRDATATGFVFAAGPAGANAPIEGYLFLSQKRTETGKHDSTLTDVAFATPRAGRRILTFFADLRSMCDSVTWRAAPGDPLLLLMPEHAHQIRVRESWMLRVVDAPRAIEARGYSPGLAAECRIDLRDDSCPTGSGSWAVHVARGRAVARPVAPADGALPAINATERGMAALYSGYVSAHALRDADLLRADDEACAIASAIFAPARTRAGAGPSMPDFF